MAREVTAECPALPLSMNAFWAPDREEVGPRLREKYPVWQLCTEINNKITHFNERVWTGKIRIITFLKPGNLQIWKSDNI